MAMPESQGQMYSLAADFAHPRYSRWESLLSTHGSENRMIGDFFGAVVNLQTLKASFFATYACSHIKPTARVVIQPDAAPVSCARPHLNLGAAGRIGRVRAHCPVGLPIPGAGARVLRVVFRV